MKRSISPNESTTHLSYQFPLKGIDRESSIDIAVKNMVTGREGLFTLMSNHLFSLTLRRHQDGSEDRIFSNFCPIIRRLRGMKSSPSPRKSHDRMSITSFAA